MMMIEMRNAKFRNAKYEIRNPKSWTCTKNRKVVDEIIEMGDLWGQQNGRDGGAIYWLKNELKWPKRSDASAIWWQHWELKGQVENIDRDANCEIRNTKYEIRNTKYEIRNPGLVQKIERVSKWSK